MVFGLNIVAMVKAELLKYKDKAGNPIVIDALTDVEQGLVVVVNFVSKLTPADITSILALLPASVAAKFTATELSNLAEAIANLPTDFQAAETEIATIESELKS